VVLRVLAAVAVAVLTLAGCSAMAGAAAVVDGEPISEEMLAETTQDFRLLADAPARSVLQALVVSPFWIEAASQTGLGTSVEEGRARIEELAADAGLDPASLDIGPGLVSIGQVLVAQRKAVEAGVAAELGAAAQELVGEAEIEISPRYGEWSGDGLVATSPPWLIVQPAEPQ
jgi:hypothetical protein